MKKQHSSLYQILSFFFFFFVINVSIASHSKALDEPDSAYLFAYSVNEGRSGLTLAWSTNQKDWHAIGPEHCFLFSDFGRWGTQKRMFSPFLIQDESGLWHCIWQLNDEVGQFAHTTSSNLYEWGRQSYPTVMSEGNVKIPEVSWNGTGYTITWLSENKGKTGVYQTTTTDFKNYTQTGQATEDDRLNNRTEVTLNGQSHTGIAYKVSWSLIEDLIKHFEWTKFHNSERNEVMADDPVRFATLEAVDAQISLDPDNSKEISDMLIGIFFEDISYAADGGLYAELIQNRDFEYHSADKGYSDSTWNSKKAWSTVGGNVSFEIDSVNPIHPNNKHFAVLDIQQPGSGLINEGWDGIPVDEGEKYNFSVFAKTLEGDIKDLFVQLVDENGKILGEIKTKKIDRDWKKLDSEILVNETSNSAHLQIVSQQTGRVALDMISLFPQYTFKGHKNGLRADLAQTIADLNPRFVRFPGGCVAHGDGLENIYRWKNSIGPLEARKPMRNIWGYHQTLGLGYYEYFQFCEDIGAEPIPVLAAGVPCQNSSTGGHGQCGGIPMDEMDEYVQDVLDLIEWANGDKNTEWGKKRAEAGHPKPFNLKYLGIGNEDLITDIFEERFTMIYNAVRKRYPEITVIGTVGPFYMGTDYEEGWELATKLDIPMVDEHYYQPPGWFINNQDYYDKYDRDKSKVYLGEYAAHVRGRRMNVETALSEALYLTAVERNADIVTMTSFAPLLAKEEYTDWNPDLIYFNNTEVKPTVDYYVQKLYGNNAGDSYVPSQIILSSERVDVNRRIAFSAVRDSQSNDLILKLANLLPVEVNSTIDLSEFGIEGNEGVLTVLKGEPDDENARPVESHIQISEELTYQLPPYSFSVIRIPLK